MSPFKQAIANVELRNSNDAIIRETRRSGYISNDVPNSPTTMQSVHTTFEWAREETVSAALWLLRNGVVECGFLLFSKCSSWEVILKNPSKMSTLTVTHEEDSIEDFFILTTALEDSKRYQHVWMFKCSCQPNNMLCNWSIFAGIKFRSDWIIRCTWKLSCSMSCRPLPRLVLPFFNNTHIRSTVGAPKQKQQMSKCKTGFQPTINNNIINLFHSIRSEHCKKRPESWGNWTLIWTNWTPTKRDIQSWNSCTNICWETKSFQSTKYAATTLSIWVCWTQLKQFWECKTNYIEHKINSGYFTLNKMGLYRVVYDTDPETRRPYIC